MRPLEGATDVTGTRRDATPPLSWRCALQVSAPLLVFSVACERAFAVAGQHGGGAARSHNALPSSATDIRLLRLSRRLAA